MELKRAKVVMLPEEGKKFKETCGCTEEQSCPYPSCNLNHRKTDVYYHGDKAYLYVTVKGKINVGDYYLYYLDHLCDLMQCQDQEEADRCNSNSAIGRASFKIIGSTNRDLLSYPNCEECNDERIIENCGPMGYSEECKDCPSPIYVASIKEEWITKYCEDGGIEDVYVELSPSGDLIIHEIKTSFTHDDITHALAYGYQGRREGLSHEQVLINYKQANKLL